MKAAPMPDGLPEDIDKVTRWIQIIIILDVLNFRVKLALGKTLRQELGICQRNMNMMLQKQGKCGALVLKEQAPTC